VDESPTSRWFLRLSAFTLVVGMLAGVFELTASQVPYTPLHVGVLAAPFAQLRRAALWLSVFACACAWLRPKLAGEREPWLLFGLVASGSVLSLGAMLWGAVQGKMAIQVFDPSPGAGRLALLRLTGQALVLLGVLGVAFRLVRAGAHGSHILQQHGDDARAAHEDEDEERDDQPDDA
jgi:hypothetical protein